MFPDIGKLASLLKNAPEMLRQAQQLQGRMGELQEKLARLRIEGTAGGGMVTATVNGQLQLVGIKIDPVLSPTDDREMLEEMVVAAVNQATEKARQTAAEEMSGVMGAAGGVPGMGDWLAKAGLGPTGTA